MKKLGKNILKTHKISKNSYHNSRLLLIVFLVISLAKLCSSSGTSQFKRIDMSTQQITTKLASTFAKTRSYNPVDKHISIYDFELILTEKNMLKICLSIKNKFKNKPLICDPKLAKQGIFNKINFFLEILKLSRLRKEVNKKIKIQKLLLESLEKKPKTE